MRLACLPIAPTESKKSWFGAAGHRWTMLETIAKDGYWESLLLLMVAGNHFVCIVRKLMNLKGSLESQGALGMRASKSLTNCFSPSTQSPMLGAAQGATASDKESDFGD